MIGQLPIFCIIWSAILSMITLSAMAMGCPKVKNGQKMKAKNSNRIISVSFNHGLVFLLDQKDISLTWGT